MKILFLTVGDETVASSRTRVFQYLPHLRMKGHEVQVLTHRTGLDYRLLALPAPTLLRKILIQAALQGISLFHLVYSPVQVLRLFWKARAADVVFIQKVLLPVAAQRALSRIIPSIVFDYDDALYADEKSYDKVRLDAQIKASRLVVLENENTEAYAHALGTSCLRITGPIDCRRYMPRKSRGGSASEIVLGWIGSRSTTEFLRILATPLAQLCAKFPNVVCEWIGAGELELPGVRVRRVPWDLSTEVAALERFDIGLMPLVDNAFTRGKGGYKILQYMAMGIPAVASPVGVNSEIIQDAQTGYLCRDSDWYPALERMVVDSGFRHQVGQAARHRAEQLYSFEASTPKLIQALFQTLRR